MAAFKVKVLYDFEGHEDAGELSINVGDVLTVTATDIGEGWWEGSRDDGRSGLFPEAYVTKYVEEESNIPPPSILPPPLPSDWSNESSHWVQKPWDSDPATASNSNPAYDQDDWDSDFDDVVPVSSHTASSLNLPKNRVLSGSSGDLSSRKGSSGSNALAPTTRTNFNRFSPFVKSGSENYILGKCSLKVKDSEHVTVIDAGNSHYVWLNNALSYNCAIASPTKESKLHGLKSYIAYQLTPSFNNINVSRRYKRFDWLHERLLEKYAIIPIPPLPDKQIQGRYEEEFIEHRMNQLQNFVDRVCSHPILSQSEVWQHFLTSNDEKRWKVGKRAAEKDALVGGNFLMTIKRPEFPLDQSVIDHQIENFTRFSSQFDTAVKNMLKICAEQTQKYQTQYKNEFLSIAKSFISIGAAMDIDSQSSDLNKAIKFIGKTYEDISGMYDDQPRNDWEPLGDTMHDYRGLLSSWPSILQIHSGAVMKRKEFDRYSMDGKVPPKEASEIATRTDNLSYAIMAEMNYFHETKIKDLKSAHVNFLQEQITFYQKITEKLQDSLRRLENYDVL